METSADSVTDSDNINTSTPWKLRFIKSPVVSSRISKQDDCGFDLFVSGLQDKDLSAENSLNEDSTGEQKGLPCDDKTVLLRNTHNGSTSANDSSVICLETTKRFPSAKLWKPVDTSNDSFIVLDETVMSDDSFEEDSFQKSDENFAKNVSGILPLNDAAKLVHSSIFDATKHGNFTNILLDVTNDDKKESKWRCISSDKSHLQNVTSLTGGNNENKTKEVEKNVIIQNEPPHSVEVCKTDLISSTLVTNKLEPYAALVQLPRNTGRSQEAICTGGEGDKLEVVNCAYEETLKTEQIKFDIGKTEQVKSDNGEAGKFRLLDSVNIKIEKLEQVKSEREEIEIFKVVDGKTGQVRFDKRETGKNEQGKSENLDIQNIEQVKSVREEAERLKSFDGKTEQMKRDKRERAMSEQVKSENLETGNIEKVKSENLETGNIEKMKSQNLETGNIEKVNSENLETRNIEKVKSETLETDNIEQVKSERDEKDTVRSDGEKTEQVMSDSRDTERYGQIKSENLETENIKQVKSEREETETLQSIDGMTDKVKSDDLEPGEIDEVMSDTLELWNTEKIKSDDLEPGEIEEVTSDDNLELVQTEKMKSGDREPVEIEKVKPDNLEFGKTEHVKPDTGDFVSSDPEENADNNNPEWELLKKLETDEERYKAVRLRWRNLVIPNPNKNLTYRSRGYWTTGEKQKQVSEVRQNTVVTSRKRTHSADPIEHQIPAKRQRTFSCTEVFDRKMLDIHKNLTRERNVILQQHERAVQNLVNKTNHQLRSYPPGSINDERIRTLHVQNVVELRYKCDNRLAAVESESMNKLRTLEKAMEEVRVFNTFYQGLEEGCDDALLLTDEQLVEVLEEDHLYECFAEFYNG